MPREINSTIELVGGPFDGHVETFHCDPEQLPWALSWPVNRSVFRLLSDKREWPTRPFTSVALYQRSRRGDAWCYDFVGALPPGQPSASWAADEL
jgi:hypothetical protein